MVILQSCLDVTQFRRNWSVGVVESHPNIPILKGGLVEKRMDILMVLKIIAALGTARNGAARPGETSRDLWLHWLNR